MTRLDKRKLSYLSFMRLLLTTLACLLCLTSSAQSLTSEQIHQLADEHFYEGMNTLKEFLALPNIGKVPDNIDLNVDWCIQEFEKLDFETQVLTQEGVKHVFVKKILDKKLPTLLFYLQIDGQPVDTSAWHQESPFKAVLKECVDSECEVIPWEKLNGDYDPDWKIFARSASDSKGPATAFLQSLKILQALNMEANFNIKAIMDFQEELGSPTLADMLKANIDLFEADAMLIIDGTRPPGNLPTLTFGARGIATLKLTVFGARKNLHSGHYGNYAPNPVFGLSRLLAAIKDEDGKVLIPGFYEGVVMDEARKKMVNIVPENKEQLMDELGIVSPESIGGTYQEALQFPSFNVRGLQAAWVGKGVRTIIPSEALAEVDMRLVVETPAERQIKLVTEFIQSQGFHVLDRDPTDEERRKYPKIIKVISKIGSRPFRTDLDSPLGAWLGQAMDHVFGEGNYIRMQATGGSQPIAPFITTLGIPAISVRIPNPDNSIHAPNENLRIGNFHEGLKMCLGILTQKYE